MTINIENVGSGSNPMFLHLFFTHRDAGKYIGGLNGGPERYKTLKNLYINILPNEDKANKPHFPKIDQGG
jgi:hypothetical protein